MFVFSDKSDKFSSSESKKRYQNKQPEKNIWFVGFHVMVKLKISPILN